LLQQSCGQIPQGELNLFNIPPAVKPALMLVPHHNFIINTAINQLKAVEIALKWQKK